MEEPPAPVEAPRRFRWSGFADAWSGLRLLVRTQPNARVHFGFTLLSLAMAIWLGLSAGEWAALITVTALVWVAEALNTAIEMVVDIVSPERQPLAGWAKDAAAGAVLAAAVAAVIVGLILFLSKLLLKVGLL